MKFLLSVLTVRFIIGLFSQKDKNAVVQDSGLISSDVRHPAEFTLR